MGLCELERGGQCSDSEELTDDVLRMIDKDNV